MVKDGSFKEHLTGEKRGGRQIVLLMQFQSLWASVAVSYGQDNLVQNWRATDNFEDGRTEIPLTGMGEATLKMYNDYKKLISMCDSTESDSGSACLD